MAGSAPLEDGGPAWGRDEPSRSRPPPRLAGAPLPCGISGDGRPPRPAAPTSTSKKCRSTFVAPTRPAASRPGGIVPRQDLGAGGVWPRQDLSTGGVRPRQIPNAALAPSCSQGQIPDALLPRQLFPVPPPVPRVPSPLRHGAAHPGFDFTGAGRKAQTPSFSEPAHLPSHQVQKRSMQATATATASDTPRTASTMSLQDDDDDYFNSSSMPFYEWSPTQDPMGSSQSFVGMLTQEDSEADVEVLTEPAIADSGSIRGRGGNYNHNEDIQLCWSWMAITYDPRIGNDQPKGTYWNRIAQHFHDNKTFVSSRNVNSLEKRWNTIQREYVRFQECIEKIERLRPSGVPHTEYINVAQKSYDETKGFPYIHCWMEVRHTEKFQSVYEAMKQSQGGSRQSKSTTPSQEAQEDDRAPSERPPGRKKSKQKQKRNDGEDEYAVQLATLIQMKAEEQKKRDERWQAEKELEERKKELEERKLLWDQEQKIMFCNTSDMDESQRAYVMAMRRQIAAAKEALVKASGGGSTSEQASST
ncbi:unnamed protein product [Urochloa humidicola]